MFDSASWRSPNSSASSARDVTARFGDQPTTSSVNVWSRVLSSPVTAASSAWTRTASLVEVGTACSCSGISAELLELLGTSEPGPLGLEAEQLLLGCGELLVAEHALAVELHELVEVGGRSRCRRRGRRRVR